MWTRQDVAAVAAHQPEFGRWVAGAGTVHGGRDLGECVERETGFIEGFFFLFVCGQLQKASLRFVLIMPSPSRF